MKLNKRRSFPFSPPKSINVYLIFLFLIPFFFSCEEPSFIGSEIQPPADRFDLRYSEDFTIRSFTYQTDSVETNRLRYSMLGSINDPVFGFSGGSFATQFGLYLAGHRFGTSPSVDSLILYLKYIEFYGDPEIPQQITVYELNDSLMYDSIYYSDFDISAMYDEGNPLGTKVYSHSENDSIISVPITNEEFREKLLNADSTAMASSMNFLEYMKGFYIKTEPVTGEGGAIYRLDLLSEDSRMTMYYTNITEDTLSYDYIINQGAARVNIYDHDHTETDFYDNLNQSEIEDSVVYVQGLGGLMTKVVLEDLETWRDSVPVAVNSAKLILKPEKLDETIADFPVPQNLAIYYYNEEGEFSPVVDFFLGSSYFGGRYDDEHNRYVINITSFVQYFITGEIKTNELYILVRDYKTNPGRVVLKGVDHSDPIKLEIKYNRF